MECKKILLAQSGDSDPSTAIDRMFFECGYQVTHVDNGNSAYKEIHQHQYDLVITEMNLPRLSGLDLVQRIKETNQSLPVIVIAENADVTEAVEAMKRGASDFLIKPLTAEIIEMIRSYISNGSKVMNKAKQSGTVEIITQNLEMKRLLQLAKDIADSRASVFIQGESGTGKELFARYIHCNSVRKHKPFVAINCSALPATLLESELFGHEKGAFTGAINRKKGKFEMANEGTLLLDEISEMDYPLQSKLLRVLQEREIDRIGGLDPVPIDVRFIATTNRVIEEQIKDGRFREDLYYRLNVIPIQLPLLRERRDDLPILAQYFIEKYNMLDRKSVKGLTEDAMLSLIQISFKGNVRELENIIERAVLLCKGDYIDEKTLFVTERITQAEDVKFPFISTGSLRELEKSMILRTLDQTNGNRTHAADILGISIRTLRNKLNEYKKNMAMR